MSTSGIDHAPRRVASRHPGLRGLGLTAVVCPVVLASACAGLAPPRPAAPPRPSVAAATPTDTAAAATPSPASGAPSQAPVAASPVPRCQEPGLAAGVLRYDDGGGQLGMVITLTNTGTASCFMYGYPGLGLQDAAHQVLTSQTHWGPTYFAHDPGPSLIVLAPGQAASASVALGVGTQRTPWASYLEVTPPGDYRHALILLSYGLGGTNGDLYVTAMARQTTIYRGGPGGCGCLP